MDLVKMGNKIAKWIVVRVYLQGGKYNLLHRVEVCFPEELGLLSQG